MLRGFSATGLTLLGAAIAGRAGALPIDVDDADADGAGGFPQPQRPLRLIVPFPPGGTSDLRARQVCGEIERMTDWRFVIENRSGASGTIGSAMALREPADGHTLLLGTIGTLAINPWLLPAPGYDIGRDVQPVIQFSRSVSMLMAHRDSGIDSLQSLQTRVAARGPLPFASTGNATIGHMVAEIYQRRAGIALTHVPYRGTAPAVQDFSSAQVPLLIETPSAVWPLLQSGIAVPLAVTSQWRMPQLPTVPTFVESGYPDMVFDTWQGVVTRRGIRAERLALLNATFERALRVPAVVRSHEAQVNVVVGGSPAGFEQTIRREAARWRAVVAETGARIG